MKTSILTIIPTLLILHQAIHADNLDQSYRDRLLLAQSATRAKQVQSDYHNLRLSRQACRLQIQAQRVPTSCYEALALERRWFGGQRQSTSEVEQKLDRICAQHAQKLKITALEADNLFLSRSCRNVLLRAQTFQRYREQEAWSEN